MPDGDHAVFYQAPFEAPRDPSHPEEPPVRNIQVPVCQDGDEVYTQSRPFSGLSLVIIWGYMNILRMSLWTGSVCQTGLILVGVALRLRHYFGNRSFWQDEICLALSIVNRSFTEIWHHVLLFPDFAQAPLFFQLVAKACVGALGDSELSLRLFPVAASIASLFLARRFFKRALDPFPATMALALFAIIEPLVYFAAELKSYGLDVLAALIVYEMFWWLKKEWTLKRLTLFAAVGAVIIWFSYAMLFVLAGCGLVEGIRQLRQRNVKKIIILAGCYLFWLLSFILLYQLSLSRMLNPDLLKNWSLTGGFSPDPIWTLGGLAWAGRAFLDMFRFPLGLGWTYPAALFFSIGCYGLYRRDREFLAFLVLPFLAALLAGALGKYPFFERMILFLVPSLLVVVSSGVRDVALKLGAYRAWMPAVLVAAVFLYPAAVAGQYVVKPRGHEQNREAMAYLTAHYKPGDLIAVSPQAQYPLWYYGHRFGLNARLPLHAIGEGLFASPVLQLFPDAVDQEGHKLLALRKTLSVYDSHGYYRKFMLMGKGSDVVLVPADSPGVLKGMGRVWVFLAHHNNPGYPSFVDAVFSKAGKKLDHFDGPGVMVALYNIPGGH